MPPDNSEGFLSSVPGKSTISRTSATFFRTSASGSERSRRKANPTFSATVMESKSAALWNNMPNLCRTRSNSRSFIGTMSSPSISTCPESGVSQTIRVPTQQFSFIHWDDVFALDHPLPRIGCQQTNQVLEQTTLPPAAPPDDHDRLV